MLCGSLGKITYITYSAHILVILTETQMAASVLPPVPAQTP